MEMLWMSAMSMTSMMMILSNLKNNNPMMMSWKMMMITTTLMISSWMMTSICYPQSIMLMVFLGGILVAFMTISSLMPNKKMIKSKTTWILTVMITSTLTPISMMKEKTEVMMKTKEMMFSNSTTMTMIMMMTLLFFSISTMMTKEMTSIRYHI